MRVMVALAVLGCSLIEAQDPPSRGAAEVAAKVQRIRQTANFRASGRLVRVDGVDGQGRRKAYRIAMRATAGAGTIQIAYDVTEPEPARMSISMESRQAGPAIVRMGHGGEKTLKNLPFANWREAVLDSDLTFEDLLDDQFRWSRQSLAPAQKYGARQCLVLKSEPGPADRSHYSLVTSWLDETILHPVKVEKVVRGSGVVKEFLYYGLRKSGGLWSASQIEVRTKGKKESTFLIITRGAVDKASAESIAAN